MRRVSRCLCGIALLASTAGVANAAGGSPAPAGAKVYVVKGVIAQFIPPAGTSVGSISVRVGHSSRNQRALRGMLLTFGIDDGTHVVGSIRADATCSVRVRAATADDLPNTTALQIVVDSRDAPKAAAKGKGHKTPSPASGAKPSKPAEADSGADKAKPESPSEPAHTPPSSPPSGSHSSNPKSDGKGHK
jgi:hypothetical protein